MAKTALLSAVLLLCLSQTVHAADSGNSLPGSLTGPTSATSTLRGGFSGSLMAAGKPLVSAKLAAARSDLEPPPGLRVGSSSLESVLAGMDFQWNVEHAFEMGKAEPEDLARAKVLSPRNCVYPAQYEIRECSFMTPRFPLVSD